MVVIVGIALLAWVGSMLLGSRPLLPSDGDVTDNTGPGFNYVNAQRSSPRVDEW